MAKKIIEGGTLTPDCNFEVSWSSYRAGEIQDAKKLFELVKTFLWNRLEGDRDCYPMLDVEILNSEGESFKTKYVDKGVLIPNPTKREPFQLIHEHTLEDASYALAYRDETAVLGIEYRTYGDRKFLIGISQQGKECPYEFQGDGGTQDQYVTFRFLDKNGEIQSVRSSAFAPLPLEFSEDSEKDDLDNLRVVAGKFFDKLVKSHRTPNTRTSK